MNKERGNRNESREAPEMTVRDVLAPLFRHRRVVLGTFAVVFVVAILLSWLWASRYYVSRMQVVVEQDRSDPIVSAGQNGTVLNNKPVTLDQITSEIALLQGEDMLKTVVTACGLDKGWSPSEMFMPNDAPRRQRMKQERAARALATKLKVEAEKTSDVIDVSYGRVGEPETPACVLQTLSKLYVDKHLQLLRPAGSSDFFADETAKYKKALDDAETKLVAFSANAGVAAPDLLRTDLAQQVALSEAALNQAEQMASADQRRMDDLKKQMAITPKRSPTTESRMAPNLLLENLQASLLKAEVKRTELLLKYDPSYPLVVEADQEIAETKAAIAKAESESYLNTATDRDGTYEYLRQDLAKSQADLASAKATAGTLTNNIRKMRLQMVEYDRDAVQQGALARDAKAAEASYLLYLTKREEERTSDALDKKGIANVAIAVAPTLPALPDHSPLLVLAMGLFAALLAGVASGYVAEHLDNSFRTPDEVMNTLSMPVLAVVTKKVA
jgi:succinoglycan biosynthesis transport protein ExoP